MNVDGSLLKGYSYLKAERTYPGQRGKLNSLGIAGAI